MVELVFLLGFFWDQKQNFPFNQEVLGQVLGQAKGKGNDMAQWILKANGRLVPCQSLRPLKVEELHSATELKKREIFNGLIERRWGTSINPPTVSDAKDDDDFEEYYWKDEAVAVRKADMYVLSGAEDKRDPGKQLLDGPY
jgi:hypothetical protein